MRTSTATAALGLVASVAIVPLALASGPATGAGETCDGKAATVVVQPGTARRSPGSWARRVTM